MPSIELEIDEFEIRSAVEDALDRSDLQSEVSGISNIVERIEDKLDAIDGLDITLDKILELFSESKKEPEPQKVGRLNEDGVFSGFRTGEHVILINALHPAGIRAVVDPAAYSSVNWDNTVPVKRDDTGDYDIFPAQHTILLSSMVEYLEHIKSLPDPEPAKEEPTGDPIDWNLRAFERAIEDGSVVTFMYNTPAPSYSALGPTKKLRKFKPFAMEKMGPLDRQTIISGVDVDLQLNRSFRVDRIDGYITVE